MNYSDEQLEIIQHQQGHAKIIAVAGSGKTTTMVGLILNKLSAGLPANKILAVMYNKSAQIDFEQKLMASADGIPLPRVRTFHSLGLSIYQQLVKLGVVSAPNWRPLNVIEQDQLSIKSLMLATEGDDQLQQEIKRNQADWIPPFNSYVEFIKSTLISPDKAYDQLKLPKQQRFFIKAFVCHEQLRTEQKRITYADMLYVPIRVFGRHSELISKFENHFDLALIDEYQDINETQYQLIKILAGQSADVVAVGDPDQTIYEFRGSTPDFIINRFDSDFPHSKILPLSKTYRYGIQSAIAANLLIGNNKQRIDQQTIPNIDNHTSFEVIGDRSTQKVVLDLIEQYKGPLNEIAVLCRVWSLSAPVELALLNKGIPYQLNGGKPVLQRNELKPLLFILELASQQSNRPEDEQRLIWRHLMMTPHLKIKQPIIDTVATKIANSSTPIRELKTIANNYNGWEKKQLIGFSNDIVNAVRSTANADRLLRKYIMERDYFNALADNAPSKDDGSERVNNCRALINYFSARQLKPIEALEDIKVKQAAKEVSDNGIVITSIHKSKGLEWPITVIANVTEKFFPNRVDETPPTINEIESERRLLYVAITRAKKRVIIASSDPENDYQASRFIAEMEHENINLWEQHYRGSNDAPKEIRVLQKNLRTATKIMTKLGLEQLVLTSKPSTHKQINKSEKNHKSKPLVARKAFHSHFGQGDILSEDNNYITIKFAKYGEKIFKQTAIKDLIRKE